MIINKIMKNYKNFYLDINNLSFDYFGLIGIIGDNGAGKTTLMNILAGKIKAKNIDVKIFNSPKIYGNEKIYQNSFYLSSNATFKGKLKVIIEDFEFIFKQFDTKKCETAIAIFGLDTKMKFSSLSQGMKVQFILAIAQSLPVAVLYLDEITNGLDTASRAIVYEYIKILSNSKLVFMSTHILDKNMDYFDRILFLEKGMLMYDVKNNQRLIKENDIYKVVDIDSLKGEVNYDIIQAYKEMSAEKARRLLNG